MSLFVPFSPGSAGTYKLDSHGDRDVDLSVIYTTTDHKVPSVTDVDLEAWGKLAPQGELNSQLSSLSSVSTFIQL